MTAHLLIALLLVPLCLPAQASERGDIRTLSNVTATTQSSGPPIWEFSRDGKKLLVLGTIPYLPKGTTFESTQVERKVAQAQALVSSPGLVVGDNIGLFRGLTMWPRIRKSKFNTDGRTLQDALPPALYGRWYRAQRTRLGSHSTVARLRPAYAAFQLFESATDQARLEPSSPAIALVRSAARKNHIAILDAAYRLPIAAPKTAIEEFDIPAADDIQCLAQTIDQLDAFVAQAPELGNAWASGDVNRLERWSTSGTQMSFCWATLTNQAIASQQGIPDIHERIDERWLAEIRVALATHDTVFATVPLRELFKQDGLGAKLRRAGFVMTSPE